MSLRKISHPQFHCDDISRGELHGGFIVGAKGDHSPSIGQAGMPGTIGMLAEDGDLSLNGFWNHGARVALRTVGGGAFNFCPQGRLAPSRWVRVSRMSTAR